MFRSDGMKPLWAVLLLLASGVLALEAVWLDFYFEEPRRVAVAIEMLDSGEWLLPHIYGEPYLKKPPGFSWFIALVSYPLGRITEWSARSVVIASWLGTGAVVYYLTSVLRNRTAQLVAVAASQFSLVFYVEKAALAEIDLMLSFVLLAALSVWYGFIRSDRFWLAWMMGHAGLLLAFFFKGPVAHLFFYLPLILYFLLVRTSPRWNPALTSFLIVHGAIAAWVTYVGSRVTFERLWDVAAGEIIRGGNGEFRLIPYMTDITTFPLIVWLSMLPFGLFALGLFSRRVRERVLDLLHEARKKPLAPSAGLAVLSIAGMVPFVMFWFVPPVHQVRYVMPVFPWMAVFLGVVCERMMTEGISGRWSIRINLILAGMTLLLVGFVAVRFAGVEPGTMYWGMLLGLATLTSWFVWQGTGNRGIIRWTVVGMVVFVLLIKLGYLGLYVPNEKPERLTARSSLRPAVEWLRSRGTETVWYTSAHHLEIPYYLSRAGFTVRKRTRSIEIVDGVLATLDESDREDGMLLHVEREHHRDVYFVSRAGEP